MAWGNHWLVRYSIWSGHSGKLINRQEIEPQRTRRAQRGKLELNFNKKHTELDEHTNQLSGRIIGAAIEVHKQLGPGFLESVYEEALVIEFKHRNIPFQQQPDVNVMYRGHKVGQSRLDLLVEDCIIVELKAVEKLHPIHHAQVISYLRAKNLNLGLLINFNVEVLTRGGVRRVIYSL